MSAILYWGLPTIALFALYLFSNLFPGHWILQGEQGIIEQATVLFLLIALFYTVAAAQLVRVRCQTHALKNIWNIWLLMIALGTVYFAGEELSWGQHLLGWQTPAEWSALNDQKETNLHNTHAIFDQVPRLLLTLAMLGGGVIIPIVLRWKQIRLNTSGVLYWLLPTWICLPTVLCLLPIKLIEFFVEQNHLPESLNISSGQTKEAFIALFIMFYALSFQRRLRQHS